MLSIKQDIVIVGHGGFAKEVAFLIEDINRQEDTWNLLGYISESIEAIGFSHGKYRVYNSDDWLENAGVEINIVLGMGDPKIINMVSSKLLKNKNLSFPNIIHPNVIRDNDRVKFGAGNIVCAGTIFTTDITVGSFNVFNLNCTVGHDSKIGDCNVFNPTVNVSGGVHVKNNILIGTGAQILQNLSICDESIVGAGAVVAKNIEESGVYVGIPARKLLK
jgi:sugar O-acyltransferase (sialic acid O-acetyltransferase NeuD family)